MSHRSFQSNQVETSKSKYKPTTQRGKANLQSNKCNASTTTTLTSDRKSSLITPQTLISIDIDAALSIGQDHSRNLNIINQNNDCDSCNSSILLYDDQIFKQERKSSKMRIE